jgi:hypothetical protein
MFTTSEQLIYTTKILIRPGQGKRGTQEFGAKEF